MAGPVEHREPAAQQWALSLILEQWALSLILGGFFESTPHRTEINRIKKR